MEDTEYFMKMIPISIDFGGDFYDRLWNTIHPVVGDVLTVVVLRGITDQMDIRFREQECIREDNNIL